ncbi:MAG: alpha/beta fold hydrolase [Candidatus Sungbacteria bacterium]|nr:alpha/beta fold hydrolase [Candidatus Sungbacteria bacterium]
MRIFIVILFAILALILGAIFMLPRYQFEKEYTRVEIGDAAVLAEVARDPATRSQGLSGRDSLSEYSGMLFLFEAPGFPAIWMKDMKFPIDIVWLRKNSVVDVEENVPPPISGAADVLLPVYKPDTQADMVLEIPAGFAAKNRIVIGSRARIFGKGEMFFRSDDPTKLVPEFVGGAPSGPVSNNPALPGYEYFIETLREKKPDGSNFKIERSLERNSAYQKYSISYNSGDLKISGIMNVPAGPVPRGGFPVLILNHGLIPPEIYFSGRGSKREQDFFARQGYIVLHPDYRGLASSGPNPAAHHDFYEGYAEDVMNLISALQKLNSDLFDMNRIGMWGHSMGGGIATRVMVRVPEVRAYVLFAPISADAEDNFYELPKEEVDWLHRIYGPEGAGAYRKISPITYFADVAAPIQLHHGTADKNVPIRFSEKTYEELKRLGKTTEFYSYPGEGHEFGDVWELAAERSLQFFDKYVKNAR